MLYVNNFKCEDDIKLTYSLSEAVHSLIGRVEKESRRVLIDREELE